MVAPLPVVAARLIPRGVERKLWQMGSAADEREALRAENERLRAALRQAEATFDQFFEKNRAIKLLIDPDGGRIVDANSAAVRFYGWSKEELRARTIKQINDLPDELVQHELDRARERSRDYFQFRHLTASGVVRDVEVYSGPIELHGRELLLSVVFDTADRKQLANELAHAQRMESLGQLAGGVAHDFNNLLTAIELSATLAMSRAKSGGDVRPQIEQIAEISQSGAGLTRQLLAFCRKQVMHPQLLDVRDVVRGTEQLLRRVLDDVLTIEVEPPESDLWVLADPVQVEQVLLNLALNARDAMPDGGTFRLSVHDTTLGLDRAAPLGVQPGRYVEFRARDTGKGMDEPTRQRAFEPFFTTKDRGRGTGLGLSTAYGIVRQSGGAVELDSEPGVGSEFRVLLPRAEPGSRRDRADSELAVGPRGRERVLLAEDDDTLRALLEHVLREQGYSVTAVGDADAALRVARGAPPDLLVADVVMPGGGGPELAKTLRAEQPALKVLLVSGYTERSMEAGEPLLQKPFTADQLALRVREILDE